MHEEKEIKIIPIKIGTGEKSKELKFVCMPHILESDPIIKTYLDGQKMKLNFSPAKISPEKFSKFDDDETVTASFKELDEMDHSGGSKVGILCFKFSPRHIDRILSVKNVRAWVSMDFT